MSDVDLEVLRSFMKASPGADRRKVGRLFETGWGAEAIKAKNCNYVAWVYTIQILQTGHLIPNLPTTHLRRVRRALLDVASADETTLSVRRRCELALYETIHECNSKSLPETRFVYAFRAKTRPGVRVGKTTGGWKRIRTHVNTYGPLTPVGIYVTPGPEEDPRKYEKNLLLDLNWLTIPLRNDWFDTTDGVVDKLARGRRLRPLSNGKIIWEIAGVEID